MRRVSPVQDNGFTLVELVVAVAVLLILATIAFVGYQRLLDRAREAVCTTNVKALSMALESYILDQEAVPATLGGLELRRLERAYAKVMQEADWLTKISHSVVEYSMSREAYATVLTHENLKRYGISDKMLRCPSAPDGAVSYGINRQLLTRKWESVQEDAIIVGDCDGPVFNNEDQLATRHRGGTVAVGATKDKRVRKRRRGDNADVTTAGSGDDASPSAD